MLLDQSTQLVPSLGLYGVGDSSVPNYFSDKLIAPQSSQSMAVMISNELPTSALANYSNTANSSNPCSSMSLSSPNQTGVAKISSPTFKNQASESESVSSSFECHANTSFLADTQDISTPVSPILSTTSNVNAPSQCVHHPNSSSSSEIELARRLGVRFDSSNAAWVARWIEPHSVKKKSRWFSVAKYGELAARRLAIQACLQNTKQSDLAGLTDLHEVLASFATSVPATHSLISSVGADGSGFPFSAVTASKQFQPNFMHHPLLAAQTGQAFVNPLAASPYMTVPPATAHGLLVLPSYDGLLYQGVPENHAAWGYCVSESDIKLSHQQSQDFEECLLPQQTIKQEDQPEMMSEEEKLQNAQNALVGYSQNITATGEKENRHHRSAQMVDEEESEGKVINASTNKESNPDNLMGLPSDGEPYDKCYKNSLLAKGKLELPNNVTDAAKLDKQQQWSPQQQQQQQFNTENSLTQSDQSQIILDANIKSENYKHPLKDQESLITQNNMVLAGAGSHSLPYVDYSRDGTHQGMLAYHSNIITQGPSPQIHPFMGLSPFSPQDSRFLYHPSLNQQIQEQQRLLMPQQHYENVLQENVLLENINKKNVKVKKSHTDEPDNEGTQSDEIHSSKSVKQADDEENFDSFSDFEQQKKKRRMGLHSSEEKKKKKRKNIQSDTGGFNNEEDETKEETDEDEDEEETDDEGKEIDTTTQPSQHDREKNQDYSNVNDFSSAGMSKDSANNLQPYLYSTGNAPVSPQFLSSTRYYSPSHLYQFSGAPSGQPPANSPFITAPPGPYQFSVLSSHLHPGFLTNFQSQLDLAAAGGPALYHLSPFQQAHLGLGHIGLHPNGGSRADMPYSDENVGQQMGAAAGAYKRVQPNNMSQMMSAKMTCERGLHYSKCYRGKEECWIAVWNTKGGRIMHEAFDVNQMGFEQAKLKAREARDAAHSNNIAIAENSRPSWKSHSNTGIPHVSLDSQQLRFRAHKFGRRLCRSFSFGRRRGSYPNRESAFDAAVLWLIQTPTEEEIATVSGGVSTKIEDPTNI